MENSSNHIDSLWKHCNLTWKFMWKIQFQKVVKLPWFTWKMLPFDGSFCSLTLSMYFHVFSMVFLSMTILWWFCTAGEATTAVNLEKIEPTDIFTWFLTISISFMKLNFFYWGMFSVLTGQLSSSPKDKKLFWISLRFLKQFFCIQINEIFFQNLLIIKWSRIYLDFRKILKLLKNVLP